MHFTGSKVSLLLAGRCVLGCWAVRCSRACDVWGGIACSVLGRQCWCRGQAEQGAWVVLTMHCGCLRGVELLGAGLAALIWILVRIDFLTVRGQVGCFTGLSIAVDSQTLTLP